MGCASSAEHAPSTGDAAAAPGYDASTPFHPDPALEFAGEVEIPSPAVSELPAAAREQPHSTPPLPVRVRNPFDSLDTLQASTDVMLHTQGSVPPPPAVNDAYAFSAAAVSQAGGPLRASREGPPGQRDLWAEQELDAAANWRGASPALTMSEFSPQLHAKRVEGRACMARLHGYTRDVDQFPAPPHPLTREDQRAIALKCLAWLGALDTTAFGGAPASLTDPSLVSDSGSGYGALPATHA